MYASRSLNENERKYQSYEQECLAVVWAAEIFRQYIGRKKTIVKTDCAALQWLTQTKTHGARVMRWIMRLQEFELEIQHRKGKHSTDVDGLTRESAQSTRPYDESVIEELYPSFFVRPCVFQVKTRSADAHAKDKAV